MEISKAIEKAREFILIRRDNMGLWADFRSRNHRESIDWVSSYVGLSLLRAGASLADLELTAESMSKRQNESGGWGYNKETSAPDADSTAFSIQFLSRFGYKAEIEKAKRFLLQHQRDNWGFGTYLAELIRLDYKERIPVDTPLDGWCSAIPEVTAIALQALPDNERAIEYMKQSQNEGGFWRSYWYNSDIYATVQVIKSLQDNKYEEKIKKAQEWLAGQKPEMSFYLALLVRGIRNNTKYTDKTDSGISNLLNLQKEDGGWESHPILRVPSFSNLRPWEDSSRWREDISDQNRIFTTATCLETIFDYKEHTLHRLGIAS